MSCASEYGGVMAAVAAKDLTVERHADISVHNLEWVLKWKTADVVGLGILTEPSRFYVHHYRGVLERSWEPPPGPGARHAA
ncbi:MULTISPECIES: hypothetical protein [Streptomyces]|uniref:Uncharacterized protein n=2 Tax=Streptomyces TaxID=1883 RepID=A0ABU2RVR5_9ACTN|nr:MULTISPECIES: hypothetical protein [unclassified Streptomyces]MBK3595610.1 hypothetical protein [Streptomyces sp. MBT51]MDT0432937.1 hypothetical protein [Streptomyces sp. DSM 41770]